MKFVSFIYKGKEGYGFVHPTEEKLLNLGNTENLELPRTLLDYIISEGSHERARGLFESWLNGTLKELEVIFFNEPGFQWLPPITRPRKNIFAVGKNYLDHAKEMGSTAAPEAPVIFSKVPTTIIGHGESVNLHSSVTKEVDYEGELAIVIGKEGKGIKQEHAWEYIFGFTIINDVTARDLQQRHQQFLLGKGLDGFCPMGPFIVEREEFLPLDGKRLITKVNGEVRQMTTFDKMIYSIPVIIETLSQGMTLEPGDIIATGTPKGVGKGFKPPKFLKDGDCVEIEIDGLGTLKNAFID